MRRASEKRLAPTGTIMNSWMSRPLSACRPPLRMLNMGVGKAIPGYPASRLICRNSIPLFRHINRLAGYPGIALPTPMFNILNGGRHADNGLDIQEFMIVPVGAKRFSDALRMGAEVYHRLK